MPDCHEEAQSVIFVDYDTESISAKNPEDLVKKFQREVNNSVNWLKYDRVGVAGDKSKVLIEGTEQLKRTRLKKN